MSDKPAVSSEIRIFKTFSESATEENETFGTQQSKVFTLETKVC